VAESARPVVSTSTNTSNFAGSPAASGGIGLPAGNLTDSIGVVRGSLIAAAARSTHPDEDLVDVPWARAEFESAASAMSAHAVGNFISGDWRWTGKLNHEMQSLHVEASDPL
jgi:hypothetical protein